MITNTHEPNDALNFLQPFNNNYAPLMVLHGDCAGTYRESASPREHASFERGETLSSALIVQSFDSELFLVTYIFRVEY